MINIYCDESCHLEHDKAKAMLLGAISCPASEKNRIYSEIRSIKQKYGVSSWTEIKWTAVSPSKKTLYIALIDYFLQEKSLSFRAVVAKDKANLNHARYNGGSHDLWYYKAYYYLLDAMIGYSDEYRIFIDIKDTCGGSKVQKLQHISDTKASMHIYMLKLDGNNRPRTCDFCDYLINRIVDYCIPPSEIRKAKEKDAEYNTTQYTATLFRKAERLFTDLGNTGEVGELALSVLTQSFLHMPQVLCKMVLKTNSEVHYHGADGVYGKYDTETQKYCLYWGEAKIYADVRQALSSCFDSIKTLLTEEGVDGTRKERDMDLFRTNLDFDNPHLEKAIIEYLDPENAHYNMLEYRGVCLVGYNEESYPKDFSRVEDEIFTCIRDKVDGFKQSIQSRLKSRIPLNLFNIEVFLVPFSDVDELRNKFLERL